MDEEQLFSLTFWISIASKLPELPDNPEGTEHLVDRFVAQYLPVLLRSRAQEQRDHAWLAFWHYLVAPATVRKPFGLTSQVADLLIAEFQGALSGAS